MATYESVFFTSMATYESVCITSVATYTSYCIWGQSIFGITGCYDPHPIEMHGYAYPCPCNKIGRSDNTIYPAECGAVSGDFGKALFELVLSLVNHGSDI